jgi:predicted dehydrogenase
MINLGIMGCGWIAEKAYLPILAQMKDVDTYAVFDIDYQKAMKLQEKYHIQNISNNIDDFLSLPLDAVIIATPNNTHTYYTNMALNTGKHVLCEKPVALSKNDIESIITIAQINKKIFIPAFVNRFRKDIGKFSELVSLIGEVRKVEVNWIRKSGIPRPGTWITNKAEAGGGVLIDIGTHVIDIGLAFLPNKHIQSVKLDQGTIELAEHKGAQWNTNNQNRQLKFDVETWAKGEVSFANAS